MKKDSRGWLPRSLRGQVVLITAFGALIAAVPFTIFFSNLFVDQMREGLELKGKALGSLLAANLSLPLNFDDLKAASEVMAGVEQDEDLAYLLVLKKDGSMFSGIREENARGVPRMNAATSLDLFDRGDLLNVAVPVMGDEAQLGVIQLGFSLGKLRSATQRVQWSGVLACLLLTGLITLILTLGVSRTVVSPVREMTELLRQMGEGDLHSNPGNGSAGGASEVSAMRRALIQTKKAMGDSVRAIKQAATDVGTSATQLLGNTSQLASAAGEQAAAIAQTTSTVEEAKQVGVLSSERVQNIAEITDRSVAYSGEGLQAVQSSVDAMALTKKQVEAITNEIERLLSQVSEVSQIIATVNEVAEQSNLLAVNASIEAAKAGEFGRGFAVVAQEVKNLSDQSKKATKQVRDTLGSIRKAIEEVVVTAHLGRARTDEALQSIENTGGVINRLAEEINSTAKAAQQIAVNINQQADGMEEIAQAMGSINQAATENLSTTQQLEKSGEKLNTVARELESLVARYRI